MQKKITEYMKRLLGVSRLNLWEGDPILAEIQDLDKAVERFVYHYANPADADLVETIDEFPGLSSWNDFLNADTTVDARCARLVPWIRLPSIAPLVNLALTPEEDLALCASLVEGATEKHELVIYPYAWIKCFGPTTPEEVAKIRERIIEGVRAREEAARKRRAAAGKKVMGRERLLKQPIMAPHTPPPRERRVYFLGSCKEARIARVAEMQEFNRICEKCREEELNPTSPANSNQSSRFKPCGYVGHGGTPM